MRYIDIIREFKKRFNNVEEDILVEYLCSLIKLEFLLHNDGVEYFDENIQDLLYGRHTCENALDWDIDRAMFIVLQPLRSDLKYRDLEQIMLGWSGYLLKRDVSAGSYVKYVEHYFDEDGIGFKNLFDMSPGMQHKYFHASDLVDWKAKESCIKALCKIVADLFANIAKMSDEEFENYVALITYRLIRIHPFVDGNGRISRMLLNFLYCSRDGFVPIGFSRENREALVQTFIEADGLTYSAFAGDYLTNLFYSDNNDYFQTEKMLLSGTSDFLSQMQKEARNKLKLSQEIKH